MSKGKRRATRRGPNAFDSAGQTLKGHLPLRVGVGEASELLRISRALLYRRIGEGAIRSQKDGARTYILYRELKRYVESCSRREVRRSR